MRCSNSSRVKMELFALSHRAPSCFERSSEGVSDLEAEGFSWMTSRSMFGAGIKKFCKQCQGGIEAKLKLSLTEGEKEGKRNLIVSNKY